MEMLMMSVENAFESIENKGNITANIII